MALSGSLAMVMREVALGFRWRFPGVARISIDEVEEGRLQPRMPAGVARQADPVRWCGGDIGVIDKFWRSGPRCRLLSRWAHS